MTQKSEESKNFPARPDKTIDWLNKSRDDWKSKTQATKAELKVATQAQRRARQDRQEWKQECQQLRRQLASVTAEKDEENSNLKTKIQELERENEELKKKALIAPDDQKINRHTFSQGYVAWGMRLLRTASAGFRCVASIFKEMFSQNKIDRAPSAETLIQWDLKIGLYKLERPKIPSGGWVWMAENGGVQC